MSNRDSYNDSDARRWGTGMRWNLLAALGGPSAGMLLSVVLARILEPGQFGVVVTATTATMVAGGLFAVGLDRAGLSVLGAERAPQREQGLVETRRMCVLFALLAFAAVTCFWRFVPLLGGARFSIPAALVGVAAATEVIRLVSADLLRIVYGERASFLTGIGIRSSTAAVLAAAHAALFQPTPTSTLLILVVSSTIYATIALRALVPRTRTRMPQAHPDRVRLRHALLREGLQVMLATGARAALTNGHVLIVAAFYSEAAVGSYALSVRLASAVGAITVASNLSSIASLTAVVRTSGKRALDDATKLQLGAALRPPVTAAFWFGVLAAGLLAATADFVVPLLFGSGFYSVPTLVRVLLIGQVANLATGSGGAVLLVLGRVYVSICMVSLAAAFTLASAWVIASSGGPIVAITIAVSLGLFAENLGIWWFVRAACGVRCGPSPRPAVAGLVIAELAGRRRAAAATR